MKFILKHFGKIVSETQLEEGKEYLIGRHKECHFVLQEETGLSRSHIKIYQSSETGNWIIESISELGGLYLEGEEVDGVELTESSLLTLKNYVLEFIKEPSTQGEESAPKTKKVEPEINLTLDDQEEFNSNAGTRIVSDTDFIYSLNVYIHGEISEHISLNEGNLWTIGRSEECDISIDYSVLTRKHLQISRKDGQFYIKDLGGANQTFLNDTELKPHTLALLKANDEISISDLSIIFEVRNKHIEQMMSHLPEVVPEEQDKENLPGVALSKVVLEEALPEEVTVRKSGIFQPKIIIVALAVLAAFGGGLYFNFNLKKKKNQALLEQQLKNKEHKDKMEAFYQEALSYREEGKYQLCITQIEDLHQLSSVGYYRDSKQLLLQCDNAVTLQRQQAEYLAQEEERRQTEEQIQTIVEKCQKQFKKNIIQTETDLDECAKDILDALDPTNAAIAAIRMEIQERENLNRMAEEKRQAYRAMIRRKKALYNKAKTLRDNSALTEAPKVVRAYDRFLKAAKGTAALKDLHQQAESEKTSLQEKYDNELARLHQSCDNLMNTQAFKKAYYNCKKVLGFKKNDKKAKEHMKIARLALQKSFKLKYEKSMSDETYARIEEAKKIWQEILEQDIKEGYYYRKALSQLKKYKSD